MPTEEKQLKNIRIQATWDLQSREKATKLAIKKDTSISRIIREAIAEKAEREL